VEHEEDAVGQEGGKGSVRSGEQGGGSEVDPGVHGLDARWVGGECWLGVGESKVGGIWWGGIGRWLGMGSGVAGRSVTDGEAEA
jgi:hypothetical protein